MNKAFLSGFIGRDPETRFAQSGTAVTNFSLATTKKYKGESKTTWHNCVSFGKTAELIAEYFKKGDGIELEGEIQNRSYEKNGETKYVSEIIVNSFEWPKVKKGDGSSNQQATKDYYEDPGTPGGDDVDDDLPF